MVGSGSSCGACKFLRRKCEDICIFAPYFSYEGAELHFAAVHKVFGASNVSKLLSHLPLCNRSIAAITLSFEAEARIRDPIRGCVSQILALQHQVARLQEEVETFTTQMMFKGTLTSNEAKRHFLGQNDPGNANHFNADLQVLNPSYREAIEKLEDCLFSDEQCSWEELDMYISNLEKDLMI